MKDWKERFDKEFVCPHQATIDFKCSSCGQTIFGGKAIDKDGNEINFNSKVKNFIEQIISERDKEWQKEKSELEYKLYMKTDKMYQILTQLENCLHILGKIESQKEHYLTVQDYLDGDESLQAMWRSYRD